MLLIHTLVFFHRGRSVRDDYCAGDTFVTSWTVPDQPADEHRGRAAGWLREICLELDLYPLPLPISFMHLFLLIELREYVPVLAPSGV